MLQRIMIKGNVQGVGFRASAQQLAGRLHLKGFVRNLPDSSVEICAEGTSNDLEQLIVLLRQRFDTREIEVFKLDSFYVF